MMAAREEGPMAGRLLENEPMARHTSWRAGGPARRYYIPAGMADLAAFLRALPADEPLLWLGLGSNLLVRSGGLDATVIALSGALGGISLLDGVTLRVEAGVACAQAARFAARNDLGGIEFLAGIPGTLGGALAMNAGAFGGETWQRVRAVETIDRHGVLRRRGPEAYRIAYRHVEGPTGEWFVAAELALTPGAEEGRVKSLLEARAAKQPIGEASCGSVFRNPEGDFAARLIESAGLKGRCIGKACVSTKHANFIINTGGAEGDEIEDLLLLVQAEVERAHGIRLVPEVHIVGHRGGQA